MRKRGGYSYKKKSLKKRSKRTRGSRETSLRKTRGTRYYGIPESM